MVMQFTCYEHGGYLKENGEIQIVGFDSDSPKYKTAEQGLCADKTPGHQHTKACALALLDFKPVLEPEVEANPDADPPIEAKAAVFGKSIREKITEWCAAQIARPAEPKHVTLPTKTVRVRNEKTGKLVDKEVPDGDL